MAGKSPKTDPLVLGEPKPVPCLGDFRFSQENPSVLGVNRSAGIAEDRVRALMLLLQQVQPPQTDPTTGWEKLRLGLRDFLEASQAHYAQHEADLPPVALLPDGRLTLDLGDRCLILERAKEGTAFAAPDLLLLSIVLMEGRWLLPRPSSLLGTERLSPRRSQVLTLLLAGYGEQEIARILGRSQHTIHECVVYLYRRFSVRSRAELLSHFIRPSLHL